nr:uncharacterized protein LOC108177220 [Oryctolagus cuniculus]
MWKGARRGVEAPPATVHLGRESDRVWVSCHQIGAPATPPITSAGITSLGEQRRRGPPAPAHPAASGQSLCLSSSWPLGCSGDCHSHSRCVSGTTEVHKVTSPFCSLVYNRRRTHLETKTLLQDFIWNHMLWMKLVPTQRMNPRVTNLPASGPNLRGAGKRRQKCGSYPRIFFQPNAIYS